MPLQDGLKLLEGAKRSLLAASCSVISPARFHPRMSRTEASQLIEACRLGQTERGSFTITISCPLRAVEQNQTLLPGAEPFARQATSLLMKSLCRLVDAIEADQVPAIFETTDDDVIVSANLCEAILRMQPPEERSSLSVSVKWATTGPPPPHLCHSDRVTIHSEYFEIIEDIYNELRPSEEPVSSLFVGQVDALNGDVGSDGAMQGETTLLVMHDDELVKVRADLDANDYQTAVEAHRRAAFVTCRGVLHPGRRVHRLTDVSNFTLLPQ